MLLLDDVARMVYSGRVPAWHRRLRPLGARARLGFDTVPDEFVCSVTTLISRSCDSRFRLLDWAACGQQQYCA